MQGILRHILARWTALIGKDIPGSNRTTKWLCTATGIALLVVSGFLLLDRSGIRLTPGAHVVPVCEFCPEMVAIPAGSFQMGSPHDSPELFTQESPQHIVSVPAFELGRTEVTRGQFAVFIRDTGYQATGCRTWNGVKWEPRDELSWRNPGFVQDDRHPVVCMSWDDAQAYVQWLSHKTGKAYRLPTEAEWEYAARGGNAGERYWGDESELACNFANVADEAAREHVLNRSRRNSHTCPDGYTHTAPVGSFHPNGFGLYDMIGNAWEWTEDCWHPSYDGAPTDGSAWATGDCRRRVRRGGAWISETSTARLSARFWDLTMIRGDGRSFRVASPSSPSAQ